MRFQRHSKAGNAIFKKFSGISSNIRNISLTTMVFRSSCSLHSWEILRIKQTLREANLHNVNTKYDRNNHEETNPLGTQRCTLINDDVIRAHYTELSSRWDFPRLQIQMIEYRPFRVLRDSISVMTAVFPQSRCIWHFYAKYITQSHY